MCGRYVRRSDKQHVAEHLRSRTPDFPLPPDYNIAPTTFQPIVRQQRDPDRSGEADREMVLARWGLVPFFAKSLADFKGFSTFNARVETVTTAPTWREPFKRRRCLIPADGFYEWKALDDTPQSKKQPYVIDLRSEDPLVFAGLWDAWREPPGAEGAEPSWLQSFTIITTEANELMSQIHTRMPVILPERHREQWLDREFGTAPGDVEQLLALLRPFDPDAMQLAPCNPAVGNVRNNGPEMLVCPVEMPGLPLNSA